MDHKPLPSLTEQEKRVLQLLTEGLTNKEIARSLGIKSRTVEFHVCNLFQKLEVSSRTAAATVAGKLGLLE
jgi:LuxR family maltose regulon positive regulatory protein